MFSEKGEPAFLRRLREQYGGSESTPAKHQRPVARSNKRLDLEDGVDDAPTYVDEVTRDTLSKEEYDELSKPNNLPGTEDGNCPEDQGGSTTGEEVTEILNDPLLKRKDLVTPVASIGAKTKKRSAAVIDREEAEHRGQYPELLSRVKKAKVKKATKIKVSFENDEDE